MAGLVVCSVAVIAAGAPGVAFSVRDLSESQRLVGLAEADVRVISLVHALADERDDMVVFIADGRGTTSGAGVSKGQRDRVDRQVDDVGERIATLETEDRAEVISLLGTLPEVRRKALSGPGSPLDTMTSYTEVIEGLNTIGPAVARGLPARADSPGFDALPALTRAVEQASAQRGMLVGALTADGEQAKLVTAAQTAAVRERAALADFQAVASGAVRQRYDQTVTGADVEDAERYIQRLTDAPGLSAADFTLRAGTVHAALSARIGLMRSVEASLATADTARITALRDDDVTALELSSAIAAVCLLFVVGFTVHTARSITRPLAGLRRFTRGDAEEAKVVGNDEFADVARSLNKLSVEVVRLREFTAQHSQLVGTRLALTAERDALAVEHKALEVREETLAGHLGVLKGTVDGTFVDLSLRTLGLVERQLAIIEGLEDHEQDPDRLATLFHLDHLATRMRRNSENLVALTDVGHRHGVDSKPVGLVDVVRAAMSEIERYERVRIEAVPEGLVVGSAVVDTGHLVAELLENATVFSPSRAEVHVTGETLDNGEVMISVEDRGEGVPADRLVDLNTLLGEPSPPGKGTAHGMGLYIVARLAARHGIRVRLREGVRGGVTALVVLPRTVLAEAHPQGGRLPPAEVRDPVGAAGSPLPADSPVPGGSAVDTRPAPAAVVTEEGSSPLGGSGRVGDPSPGASGGDEEPESGSGALPVQEHHEHVVRPREAPAAPEASTDSTGELPVSDPVT